MKPNDKATPSPPPNDPPPFFLKHLIILCGKFGSHYQGKAIYRHFKCSSTHSELSGCVKVEVAVLGSPSLIVVKVSVGVKQH